MSWDPLSRIHLLLMIGILILQKLYPAYRIDPVTQGAAFAAAGDKSEFKSYVCARQGAGPVASADIDSGRAPWFPARLAPPGRFKPRQS
jgi:hypothetical protein